MHAIDIDELWFSEHGEDRKPGAVCLVVPGNGHSGMVFTSTPTTAEEETELAAVIRRASASARRVRLAQALLDPAEARSRSAFEQAGYLHVGDLAYMRRLMPRVGEASDPASRDGWPAGATVRPYVSTDDSAMVDLLERTYIDTLDCPELRGMRETADVLESHRLTGTFDPKLWWLLELDGKLEGAMLLNPCPDHDTVELVYLGLAPPARGRGLGLRMMEMGLGLLAGRREKHLTCAVDERNTPAWRLYERLGFTRFARRVALVKPLKRR